MQLLRTPDDRFLGLRDYPFAPHYIEIDGMRMHYLDEGAGEVILCLHGEPTWSFLYRKFFPVLAPHYRVIAPDMIGFGKSDKLLHPRDYSYTFHFNTLVKFIEQLGIDQITLVVHDWGGLLGLGILGAHPDWFKRVVILNTALPLGNRPMPLVFKIWKLFAQLHPSLPAAAIVAAGCYRKKSKSKEVRHGYSAPFPSAKYKAGIKVFPSLVPTRADQDGVSQMKKAREILSTWQKPALVLFSDKDPIMSSVRKYFLKLIPNPSPLSNEWIRNASHFLQEDAGEEIAGKIFQFMPENS